MYLNPHLETFWFSFPVDPHLPEGLGVTAYSERDARDLLDEFGVSAWFANAHEVVVRMGVRVKDLEQTHIYPNTGPMQFRGIWYPSMNIGFLDRKPSTYKSFGRI